MRNKDFRRRQQHTRAFSLLELLVVIAIIAILGGLTFPMAATMRQRSNQTSCMSNLASIGQAMRMYRLDEREYPPALFGWLDPNLPENQGKAWGEMTPTTFLYPHYIKSRRDFKCPSNPKRFEEPGTANWKEMNSISPAFTSNSVAYMVPLKKQRKAGGGWELVPLLNGPIRYFLFDSYDGGIAAKPFTNPNFYGPTYRRDWASVGITHGFFPADSPLADRELLNRNPQDNSYITSCVFHRFFEADGFTPTRDSVDIVLFQDGHAEKIPSRQMNQLGFQVEPRQ